MMVALLVAVAVIAAACGSDGADSLGKSQPDPPAERVDFRWDTFDGGIKALSDFPPGPVVVNFFASRCPPCIAEMPDFEAVSQAFGTDVKFLGLATTDNAERARALVAETSVTYEVGDDPAGDIFIQMGGFGMPTTVFVGADGFVTSVHSGRLSAEALTDKINDELMP